MREINVVVTLTPEEVLRRLQAAAEADRIQVHGTVASFRLEVVPADDEPAVQAMGALLPEAGAPGYGSRKRRRQRRYTSLAC